MRRIILFCGFAVCLSPAPVLGQPTDPPSPRVDLGFAIAGGPVPHRGNGRLLQPRVSVALTPRLAIEGLTDLKTEALKRDYLGIYYTVQGRYRLNAEARRLSTAITFGATGEFSRSRSPEYSRQRPDGKVIVYPSRYWTSMTYPIAPTFGVAMQYALAPRLAIRGDVQTIVCPYFDAIGVVPAIGVSVPVGRAYRR